MIVSNSSPLIVFSKIPKNILSHKHVSRTMKYTIILEKEEEGGYSAQCLELPGAISQGETKEEALRNIKEAIALVLEVINEEAKTLGNAAEISAVEVSA